MRQISDVLKRYRISSERDLHRLGPRFASLLSDVSTLLIQIGHTTIDASPHGLSLHLRLNKQTLPLLTSSRLDTLAKKLSVYTASPVIEIPGLNESRILDYERLANDDDYRNKEVHKFYKYLAEPWITLQEHVDAGLIQLLPTQFNVPSKTISEKTIGKKNKGKAQLIRARPHSKFSQQLLSADYETVYPSKRELIANLFEERWLQSDTQEIFLFLPYVKALSVEELRRAKEDNFDNLVFFYKRMKELFDQSKATDSEGKLIDLMKAVDYEVRQMKLLYEKLAWSRRLRGAEVMVGTAVMALSLLAPAELAHSLISAVGAIKALDGVWYLAQAGGTIKELRSKDFFVPWYVHKLSEARA